MSYKIIAEPKGLYFVEESFILEQDGTKTNSFNIFRILAILACQVEEKNSEVVAGSYIDSDGQHMLIPLDDDMQDATRVIDYGSYLEICNLTGETIKDFPSFYKSLQNEEVYNFME
jgi:hypothetical protein